MSDLETTWNREELKAYLFLYCANSDLEEKTEEREFIRERIPAETYNAMHREFNHDNDFQRIQKIISTVERHTYNDEQINSLLEEVKELFLADGEYELMEQNTMRELKRLFGEEDHDPEN